MSDDIATKTADALRRAAYVVENLTSMVTEFTGVVGPGGEREDDSIRGSLYSEARQWRALADETDSAGQRRHVYELADDGDWSLQHPLVCRPNLLKCGVHRAIVGFERLGPPVPEAGKYTVELSLSGAPVFTKLEATG